MDAITAARSRFHEAEAERARLFQMRNIPSVRADYLAADKAADDAEAALYALLAAPFALAGNPPPPAGALPDSAHDDAYYESFSAPEPTYTGEWRR